jgi:hypothetical protein
MPTKNLTIPEVFCSAELNTIEERALYDLARLEHVKGVDVEDIREFVTNDSFMFSVCVTVDGSMVDEYMELCYDQAGDDWILRKRGPLMDVLGYMYRKMKELKVG